MNDNEIINEFNETFDNNSDNSPTAEPYRAVQNQNVNNFDNLNVSGNNVFNSNNFSSVNNNIVPEVNNTFVNNENFVNNDQQQDIINSSTLYNTSNYINDSDKPAVVKAKKNNIKIDSELKTVFILMLIILVFMFFMPTIFDFIDDLKIKIFG